MQKDIQDFVNSMEESRKADVLVLIDMFARITQFEPKLWGSIIGFGKVYYKYKTNHDGYMPLLSFANRKQAITLYLSYNIEKLANKHLKGKYKYGKGCLYIKQVSDVDLNSLEKLLIEAKNEILSHDFIQLV